jgi:predicted acyl esterase
MLLLLALPGLVAFIAPTESTAEAERTNEYTWTEEFFPSADGTSLHADVFLPAWAQAGDRFPVILSIGPYFGTVQGQVGPTLRFKDMFDEGRPFERGFAYVQVDSRGYGGSAGCYDMGGRGERMDVKSAVEWAAASPWSNGRVGMWGKSYDAWTQIMALAEDPEGLEAAIIQAPLVGLYEGIYENGVGFDTGWRNIGTSYLLYDAPPNDPQSSQQQEIINGAQINPGCFAYISAMNQNHVESAPYWRERDLKVPAGDTDVPVFWTHGFFDQQTKANNLLPVWSQIESPKRAWFHQSDHSRGSEVARIGRAGWMDEAMAFLEEYLMDAPAPDLPTIEVQDTEGSWRSEDAWPPTDAKLHRFPLLGGTYVDKTGANAGNPTGGLWTVTQPAPYDLRFSGAYEVAVDVATQAPLANMVTLLYDISPDGEATMIQRGAKLIDGSGPASFESLPQDAILREGHRLGLFVSADDSSFFFPLHTQASVTIKSGSWSIPFLRYERTPDLEGEQAQPQTTHVYTVPLSDSVYASRTIDTPFPPRPAPQD